MSTGKLNPQHLPMYGWAMDKYDVPVPIHAAKRSEKYFCPVCHGDMIPKLGDIKQHHYAHANLIQCTPDNVARVVAGRWLAMTLRHKLAAGEAVNAVWRTADDKEEHTVNILKHVTSVDEGYLIISDLIDIALNTADGKTPVAILTGIEGEPAPATIQRMMENQTMVVVLNPVGVRGGQIDLQALFNEAKIYGGWWLIGKEKLPEEFVIDAKTIRSLLRVTANKPPYRFYGELHTEAGMAHMLNMNGRKLWLPPEIWEQVVGGARNRMGQDVIIMTQEWQQDDGSQIALFYITVRETIAVAIRYYPPGQTITMELGNSAFRLARTTALDLAQQLAGGMITFPQ